MRNAQRLWFLLLPAALLLAVCAPVWFKAQRTLGRAGREARGEHDLRFELRGLDPAALRAGNPGFEPVSAAASHTSGAVLDGDLYLAGPGGLSVFSTEGRLRGMWRAGLDLPASRPVALAVGRLRGASTAQLLIATAGDGLLILTPGKGEGEGESARFTQLLPGDAGARDLTAVLPFPSGEVLLGTRSRGLLVWDGSTLKAVALPLPGVDAGKLSITALAAGDGSSFLAGTRDAGVIYGHGGIAERMDSSSGLPDNQVESIAVAAGKAYVGTPVGVGVVDLAAGDLRAPDAGGGRTVRMVGAGVFAHALAVDATGTQLAVGTLDQGIQQVALGPHGSPRRVGISAPAAGLVAPEDGAGRIEGLFSAGPNSPLYALAGGSVLRASPSGWSNVVSSSASTLSDANISALAFAPDGRLWVGFFDRGVDVLNPDLKRAEHLEDDRLFCINRLALDPQRGTMAAATANGLVLFDSAGRPRQTLTRRDGLISEHINDIVFSAEGAALATPAGLTFLSSAGATSLYAFQGLVNNHVYALAVSADGKELLAGTLGGLSLLESELVRRNVSVSNSGLKHNWITAILPEPEGQGGWLIGTYGAGLERMSRDGQVSVVDLPGDAPADLVINPNAMLRTARAVYAGTLGHGLLVYLRSSGRWSVVTRGLPSLDVSAFAARDGMLFVGTENGLVRIPERTLAGFVSGGVER